MAWLVFITIVLSLASSLALVPCVRFLARKFGMVDRPDAERKLHRKPIALGGGIAVYGALVITFAAVVMIDRSFGEMFLRHISPKWYILFAAAGGLLLVGLVDDVFSLRGRQKLLLQCLILVAIVGSGTIVDGISILGFPVRLGVFAFPITILWLLISVNALNLIDGADGMATTAGFFISLGLAIVSLLEGSWLSAVVGFALAGALLGFFMFNKPPATIFLGDAGSMMIGLFVGVLAVWSNLKESTVLASAPVAILAIPLFDSSAAIVRRWLTGRSIYATDRGHLHHLLQEKFGSLGMLAVVASLCFFTTLLSVLSVWLRAPSLAALGVALVLGSLIYTRSFGNAELRLILGKTNNFTRSFFTRSSKCEANTLQTRVPLQGNGNWETVWDPLVSFAKSQNLAKVRIDLNLAWLQEGYHASWKSVRLPEKAFQLVVRIPLFTKRESDGEQVSIGILEIVAPANDSTVYNRIAELSGKLGELSPQIDVVIAALEAAKTSQSQADPSDKNLSDPSAGEVGSNQVSPVRS